MGIHSRILLAVAALLLAVPFVRPLWHISLIAPQYPEGIGLYIWASQITGEKPQDLDSINGLNHYIGMKEIVPESIPELKLIPPILGGLILAGLVAVLVGRRTLLYVWTGLLLLLALGGLGDFYKWGYDYGHNLDPTAAIKVPGMSYQPPLIGSKQLLNFFATSWPATGGWAIVLALTLAVVACVLEWRRSRAARFAAG
jgi:copper chaperone NosL